MKLLLLNTNSQIIFRMVNQKDQKATRDRSETLDADDSKQLPNLANGQGIISGSKLLLTSSNKV